MYLWLLYNEADIEKNQAYIQMHWKECKKRDIEMTLIVTQNLALIVANGKTELLYNNEKMKLPDVAICRDRDSQITKQLEQAGVLVFNNFMVADICNDKGKTYQYLADKGIPMMDTCITTKENYQETLGYPVVVKSCNGHGGSEVFLVNDKGELEDAYKKIASCKIVVQKVASNKGKDLRVYVIGKEIVACILRQSDNDFRSNFSLGGHTSVYELNDQERNLVEQIIAQFDFGLVGIDFVYHNDQMVFNEIEDVVGARMLYKNTNINLVGKYLDYIMEKVSK